MPATGEKGLGIMPILAIILIVIIAAVIVLVFRLSKTHASAQETISSGWNVTIIILSILGAVSASSYPDGAFSMEKHTFRIGFCRKIVKFFVKFLICLSYYLFIPLRIVCKTTVNPNY